MDAYFNFIAFVCFLNISPDIVCVSVFFLNQICYWDSIQTYKMHLFCSSLGWLAFYLLLRLSQTKDINVNCYWFLNELFCSMWWVTKLDVNPEIFTIIFRLNLKLQHLSKRFCFNTKASYCLSFFHWSSSLQVYSFLKIEMCPIWSHVSSLRLCELLKMIYRLSCQ